MTLAPREVDLGASLTVAGLSDQARLLAWELIEPSHDDVLAAADSLRGAGYRCDDAEQGVRVADPWGTVVHLRARE